MVVFQNFNFEKYREVFLRKTLGWTVLKISKKATQYVAFFITFKEEILKL